MGKFPLETLGWIWLGNLKKNLGKPVKVDNDVNVITLGEMWKGAAQGYKNVLGLAVGTGIGGGIIVDGKLVSGEHGAGGEVGHIKLSQMENYADVDKKDAGKHTLLLLE